MSESKIKLPAVDGLPRRDLRRRMGVGAGVAMAGTPLGALAAAQAVSPASPAVITSERLRPRIDGGVMSGDITTDRAIIWSRSDRPARMHVEYANNQMFNNATSLSGPLASAESGYTARVDLSGLARGEHTFYRVRFEDLTHPGVFSEGASGSLMLPGGAERDITFAFSGDECGQGWGINEAFGGYRIYETMRQFKPDFFIHSGDQIYADAPLTSQVVLDDGSRWNNLLTPAKAKVAETLDDFRGNYAYNLLDRNRRRFAAEVPFLVQWDNHEVHNQWNPGQPLGPAETRYTQRDMHVLARNGQRAMFEFSPYRLDTEDPDRIYRQFKYGPLLDVFMLDERSYRGRNSANRQTELGTDSAHLGALQLQWIKQALLASQALWKVIASDVPISCIESGPDTHGERGYALWANGDNAKPLGRELELAELLRFIKQHGIKNVVWVSAEVHYAAATHYSPERAAFTDFKPFWEFIGGPLNAGTFGPCEIDHTFGPDLRYVSVDATMADNRPPSDLRQYFGLARIDAKTKVMNVSLRDLTGKSLYAVDIPPEL